jgi:hypothetical protein
MGKYGGEGYEKVPKDRYITPRTGVERLAEYFDLEGVTYVEPCFANGNLSRWLSEFGAREIYRSGLEPEVENVDLCDVLSDGQQRWAEFGKKADCILTNPPWSRNLLHPMIELFSDVAPTLLLFDANWINTKQARPFQDRLVAVFPAGRHRWFAGQEGDKGLAPKEDTSWYLFDKPVRKRLPQLVLKPHHKGAVSFKEICTNLKRTCELALTGSE